MRCSKLLLLLIAQFWLRLNLVGRQQQTGFGIRNPLDESNALQRLIERFEAFHAEFDNNVPTAVGGVQCLNFRDAAQRFEHGGGMFAIDCYHGDGANALPRDGSTLARWSVPNQ